MAPTVIEGPYGANVYPKLVAMVRNGGHARQSRNGDTIDLGHVITHLYSPLCALPLGTGRNLNRKIAAAEACQLVGGFSDVELMMRASPNFSRFLEPGLGNFHGAYGIRIGHQLPAVLHKLKVAPDTRQAVITLWDSHLDNQPEKRDYPCTVALHFDITNGRLNMNVVMRSNDVWLGVPYDWFQFTQLQLTMCNVLGINPGTYTHQSFSTHLYVKDLEASDALHTVNPDQFSEAYDITGFGEHGEDAIFKVMQRAKQVTRSDLPESTDSERWFRKQFAPAAHPSQLGGNVAPGGEGSRATEPV